MVRVDGTRVEAQEAFVDLLAHPLVTADRDPVRFRRTLRCRSRVTEWCGRLGYRLVFAGTVVRLHRDPSGPQLTAAPPPMDPPGRRDLVLLAVAAAACEDADEQSTVQELSDATRALSAGSGAEIRPYDPDRRAERQAFIRALARLTELGILSRRTSDDSLLRQWEEDGTGVGGGYAIDAEALLQFTDPHTVELALGHSDADHAEEPRAATRTQRILRSLVEGIAVLYADLHPADAEYARGQRSWLAGQAVEMTGGTVEMREEGMLLRLPADRPAAADTTPVFPAATATSWFALKMLDAAMTSGHGPDELGRVRLIGAEIDALAAHLYAEYPRALTKALADSPGRIRACAESVLGGLGLIRVDDGGWTVLPPAARFRNPRAAWEPRRLGEEG